MIRFTPFSRLQKVIIYKITTEKLYIFSRFGLIPIKLAQLGALLTLLHPEWPKLYRVLTILSAMGLRQNQYQGQKCKFSLKMRYFLICYCEGFKTGLFFGDIDPFLVCRISLEPDFGTKEWIFSSHIADWMFSHNIFVKPTCSEQDINVTTSVSLVYVCLGHNLYICEWISK